MLKIAYKESRTKMAMTIEGGRKAGFEIRPSAGTGSLGFLERSYKYSCSCTAN